MSWAAWARAGCLVAALTGCPEDDPTSTCVSSIADVCAPLYTPTWEEVYTRTIASKCAQGGSACHGAAPGQGGLDLSDRDTAHGALLDGARVIAGDPGCSLLVIRLASEEASVVMPPGDALSEPERCAVEKWIGAGAAR